MPSPLESPVSQPGRLDGMVGELQSLTDQAINSVAGVHQQLANSVQQQFDGRTGTIGEGLSAVRSTISGGIDRGIQGVANTAERLASQLGSGVDIATAETGIRLGLAGLTPALAAATIQGPNSPFQTPGPTGTGPSGGLQPVNAPFRGPIRPVRPRPPGGGVGSGPGTTGPGISPGGQYPGGGSPAPTGGNGGPSGLPGQPTQICVVVGYHPDGSPIYVDPTTCYGSVPGFPSVPLPPGSGGAIPPPGSGGGGGGPTISPPTGGNGVVQPPGSSGNGVCCPPPEPPTINIVGPGTPSQVLVTSVVQLQQQMSELRSVIVDIANANPSIVVNIPPEPPETVNLNVLLGDTRQQQQQSQNQSETGPTINVSPGGGNQGTCPVLNAPGPIPRKEEYDDFISLRWRDPGLAWNVRYAQWEGPVGGIRNAQTPGDMRPQLEALLTSIFGSWDG